MKHVKNRRVKKNKGASILMVLLLTALIAIPYFYGNNTTTTQDTETTASVTKNESSWFDIYTPTDYVPPSVNTTITNKVTPKVTEIKAVSAPKVTASTTNITIDPNKSRFEKIIEISSVAGKSSLAKSESITIKNINTKDSVSITDFLIETYSHESFRIPKGYELPGLPNSVLGNIILKPGDVAVIFVGTQERKINFKENMCTGYFDQYSNFGGVLIHSCPKIDVSKRLDFSDNCVKALQSISTCRMFNSGTILDNECNEFATEHYSYAGCVRDYGSKTNFYSKRWLVWMNRGIEFFRNGREQVYLKDDAGKLVDTYTYY